MSPIISFLFIMYHLFSVRDITCPVDSRESSRNQPGSRREAEYAPSGLGRGLGGS